MGCIQSYFKKATGTSSRNSPSEEGKKFPGHAREIRAITEMPTVAITSPEDDVVEQKESVHQTITADTSKDVPVVSTELEKDTGNVIGKEDGNQKSESFKIPTNNSNIDSIDKIEYESSFISRSIINQPKPLVNTQNNKYWMNDMVCESTTHPNSIVTRAIIETRAEDREKLQNEQARENNVQENETPELQVKGEKKVLERKKTHEIVKEIVSEEFSKNISTRMEQKKVTNVSQDVGKKKTRESSAIETMKKDIINGEKTTELRDNGKKDEIVKPNEVKMDLKKPEATISVGTKVKENIINPVEESRDRVKENEIKPIAVEINKVKKPQVLDLKKTTIERNVQSEKPVEENKDKVKIKESDIKLEISEINEVKLDLKKPEVVEMPTRKKTEDVKVTERENNIINAKEPQLTRNVELKDMNVDIRKPEVVDVLTKTKEVPLVDEEKKEISESEPGYIVTEDVTKEEEVKVDSGTWKSEGMTETDISEYCETGYDDSITPAEGIENISFDDRSPIVESPSVGEEITKQISNTSLNTIGDDSEDISDIDIDMTKIKMKRFDTISSNGESSYNKSLVDPIEEGHVPSISEEYDKQLEEYTNQLKESDFGVLDVFETETDHEASVVEIAKVEVDRICEQALEKTAEYYDKLATPALRELEELTYASKCFMSANGSLSGEKENTFESISLPDERSLRPTSEEDVIRAMLKAGSSVDEKIGKYSMDSKPQSLEQQDSLDLPLPPALDDIPVQDYLELDIPEEELKSIKSPNKEEEELSLAASKIQAGFRGFLVRKQMGNVKKGPNAEDLKSIIPPNKEEEVVDEELSLAASKIQAGIRGFLVRKQVGNMKKGSSKKDLTKAPNKEGEGTDEELALAASKIQAGIRGFLVRKQIDNMKRASDEELNSINPPTKEEDNEKLLLAASKIQAGVRGYLVRKQVGNMKKGSTDLEEIKERMMKKGKRMSLDSKLADIDNIKTLKPFQEPVKEEDEAALKIQTSFRNYKARKSICVGSGVERFYKLDKLPDIEVIPEIEENVQSPNGAPTVNDDTKDDDKQIDTSRSPNVILDQEDKELLEQAALKIQATYRGFATRKSIKKTKSVVTKLQVTFRHKARQQRNKEVKQPEMEGKSEGLAKSSSCSNLLSLEEKSAMKIQAGVRGYLTRKRHSIQNTAALKIQHRYREYKSKKQNQETGETDSGSEPEGEQK